MSAADETMLAAALRVAARGWRVLPCHPTGERGKAPVGSLVPHGFHDASTDPDTIARWWARCPTAMVGAAVPDALLVLDVDPRNGGTVDALAAVLGPLPPTITAWSGRGDGGRHLYYNRPAGPLVSTALPAGIDLKVSGYVIVPPSRHPATGEPYRWSTDAGLAHLPAAAVAQLRPRPAPVYRAEQQGAAGGTDGLIRTVATAEPGGRNGALYWAACRAVEGGHGQAVLDELGRAALAAGLPEREVRTVLASARRRYAGAR